MYKTLRIIFTVLCALAVLGVSVAGIIGGLVPALITAFGALLLFFAVIFFKKKQEDEERKKNPSAPRGDFFHPLSSEVSEEKENGEKEE